MDAEIVSGDAIVQNYGDLAITMERLTALEQAGMKIALWIGALGTLVIVGLIAQWILQSPKMPALSVNLTDSQQIANTKALLENYKIANDLAMEGPSKLFDIIVVKVLYPLLTLILGYIFGTRVAGVGRTSE